MNRMDGMMWFDRLTTNGERFIAGIECAEEF